MLQATENQPTRTSNLGNRLHTMAPLSWQDTLQEEGTILRLSNPEDEILQAVQQRFSLDELHLKDIRNPAHPPHFTRLGKDAIHIILRFPVEATMPDGEYLSTSVSLLADARMCILIWPVERFHIIPRQALAGLDVHESVCKIIHILVDHLLHRVYQMREEMDDVEDNCLADVGKADMALLLQMRKELSSLARMAMSNGIAIEKLRQEPGYTGNLRLADAIEHMNRAAVMAESKAEQALNVMQAVQSLLSQRLNDVMKFLAVITVIMTPMGIIAGIFGMNFTHMDILSSPYGFQASIWAMLVLGVALATYFKIRKWW